MHISCALVIYRAARYMMISTRWTVPAALLLCATCVLVAQTHRPQPAKSAYVSPDDKFRFDFPDSLVQCKKDQNQPDRWIPDESCESFSRVCSGASGNSESTVACIAYPAKDRKGTNFEAAAFSVSEPGSANTESKCRSVAEDSRTGPITIRTINGVKFSVIKIDGVATGHGISGFVYTNFHQGKCYELDIRMASAGAGYSDTPLKPFDFEKVHRALRAVLHSFKFLK
jgi:hypothetical protein